MKAIGDGPNGPQFEIMTLVSEPVLGPHNLPERFCFLLRWHQIANAGSATIIRIKKHLNVLLLAFGFLGYRCEMQPCDHDMSTGYVVSKNA